MKPTYQNALAYYGIGGAHPGGLALTKKILKREKIDSTTRILDAGCGTGQTAAYMANKYGCQITAIDINPVMIQKARQRFSQERLPIQLVRGGIEHLPFRPQSFDMILVESVTVFTDMKRSLNEFYRVLKPEGILIMSEMTAEKNLLENEKNHIKNIYGINQVPLEDDWKKGLEESGFRSIKVIKSGTVHSQVNKTSTNVDAQPEFSTPAMPNPHFEKILFDHQQLILQFAHKLGYRVFRAKR